MFSALMVSRLRAEAGHFRPPTKALNETLVARPWHEYREGLRYMRSTPLIVITSYSIHYTKLYDTRAPVRAAVKPRMSNS